MSSTHLWAFQGPNNYYLHNHIRLMIDYHAVGEGEAPPARVVGFYVEPFSVKHKFKAGVVFGVIPKL